MARKHIFNAKIKSNVEFTKRRCINKMYPDFSLSIEGPSGVLAFLKMSCFVQITNTSPLKPIFKLDFYE